jgi:hypothetical protein
MLHRLPVAVIQDPTLLPSSTRAYVVDFCLPTLKTRYAGIPESISALTGLLTLQITQLVHLIWA